MNLDEQLAALEVKRQELLAQKSAELYANRPKRKKKGDYPVYYDLEGNLLTYQPWKHTECIIRTNEPFQATLSFKKKTSYFGSSVKYYLYDEDGHSYPMFPVSLYDAIMKGASVIDGKISGIWQVTKKGTAYGIEWQGE